MKKLPRKYAGVLFSLYTSAIMVLIVSMILVGINAGFNSEWFGRVLRSYAITWPVAFPSLLAVRPVVVKLVARSIRDE